MDTKLRSGAHKKGAQNAKGAPVPDVFSKDAIKASREADTRHRKARRNAKSRSGRLFFS